MAKGKRSNSPKRSRRGGRRSPKKSNKGVHKVISKDVPELPARAIMAELEAAAEPEVLPEPEVDPVPDAKEMLTHFFVSLTPDIHASAQSLSQLPEQEFIFGKLAAMLMAAGQFGDDVATNLAVVWTADEAWTRSLLAGEVKPVEPEAPEEPEAPVEPEALVEPEAAMELQEQGGEEAAAAAEAPLLPEEGTEQHAEPTPDQLAEAEQPLPVVQEPLVAPEPPVVEALVVETPMLPEATDKENAAFDTTAAPFFFAGAAEEKLPAAKQFGEQSATHFSPAAGLAPKDVNVQPMEFA